MYAMQPHINRNGYYSLNVQMVCDSSIKIRNAIARCPGCSHDSRMLHCSTLRHHLQDGKINYLLLGVRGWGKGYACET